MAMNKKALFAVLFSTFLLIASQTALAETSDYDIDPEEVELVSLENEDTDQVNDISLTYDNMEIYFELEGLDTFPRPLYIELDGQVVSSIDEEDDFFRPRTESEVSEGEQTLQVVLEDRDERTVLAETEVDVVEFDLEKDEDPGFEPGDVEIISVDGEDPARVNEIELAWDQRLVIELGGIDEIERPLIVEIDGERIGVLEETKEEMRIRSGVDISEGEHTLEVYHDGNDGKVLVDDTEVEVAEVDLERDGTEDGEELLNPDDFQIVSIEGQDIEELEVLEIKRGSFELELDGPEMPERGLRFEIDGEMIGRIEELQDEVRPRRDSDIPDGMRTIEIVQEGREERVVLAEKELEVTVSDMEGSGIGPDVPPEELDFKILTVNGKEADGVVVSRQDMRGEIPVEIKVEGIEEQGNEPFVKYKETVMDPNWDEYSVDGNTISLDHIPRIEEGEVEEIKIGFQMEEDFYTYDSVEVRFEHSVDEEADEEEIEEEEGTFDRMRNFFRGDEEEEGGEEDQEEEGEKQEDEEEGGGGIVNAIRNLFGF